MTVHLLGIYREKRFSPGIHAAGDEMRMAGSDLCHRITSMGVACKSLATSLSPSPRFAYHPEPPGRIPS